MRYLIAMGFVLMLCACNTGPLTIEDVCERMIECYDFTVEECLNAPWGMTESCANATMEATCEEMPNVWDWC